LDDKSFELLWNWINNKFQNKIKRKIKWKQSN
jgi:hypothetical protein